LPNSVKNGTVRRMPNIHMQFGKSVRRLRLRRKVSQEELADLAGLHATYIGRIERGRQNISLTNIGKIARALKVKPRELFKGVH
jgi:transcriptional regulator with XRE-family HTH domain